MSTRVLERPFHAESRLLDDPGGIMKISTLGAAGALTTALVAGHVVTTVVPATAALPNAPLADSSPQTHVVRAGTSNPLNPATGQPSPEHFVYAAYYPQHLQVHAGDTVRWEFTGGYGGWHSVTFLGPGGEPAAAFRPDETGIGLNEAWLHSTPIGEPDGDGSGCGRESWWEPAVEDQPACVLDAGSLDEAQDVLSSSVWDRFVAMSDGDCENCGSPDPDVGGAWVLRIDEQMPTGVYEYFCRVHPHMRGVLEVVEPSHALHNATPAEIDTQIRADYDAATTTTAALSDPAHAYDAGSGTWQVHVGAQTPDRRVQIHEYLPSVLDDVRRGDTVEFRAGGQEPNTVLFHHAPSAAGQDWVHGGFTSTGRCGTSSCTADAPDTDVQAVDEALDARFEAMSPLLPYGTVGLAFPWGCDYDGATTGAPGIPIAPYVSGRVQDRTGGAVTQGCIGGVTPELTLAPWMAGPTNAPGDLVTTGTPHSSGAMFADTLPDWVRSRPDGSRFLSRFTARFPAEGSYDFVCAAHEFMRGRIDVS